MTSTTARILIVDDNADLVELLRDYLEGQYAAAGYEIETAADGHGGLAAIARRRPDLVILDIDMPGLNGVEVLKEIRAAHRRLPVIMLTGTTNTILAAETLRLGAVCYAPKPLNLHYLDHLIALYLPKAPG